MIFACMYVMTIVRYIYIICYTCAVKWSAEWGNYTLFFYKTSVYIADSCNKTTNAVRTLVYTCMYMQQLYYLMYLNFITVYTRLITRTGMCHRWIQRTPLVILTMSRLTVIEDFWQVHAINHRFVRFLYTQDFYIADKKKPKGVLIDTCTKNYKFIIKTSSTTCTCI